MDYKEDYKSTTSPKEQNQTEKNKKVNVRLNCRDVFRHKEECIHELYF